MTDLPEIGALYQHQESKKCYRFYGMGTTLSPLDPHELNTPVNVYLDPEQPDNRFALIVTHETVETWHLFMRVESASDISILPGVNVAVYGGERLWVRTMEEFRGDKDGKPRFRKLEPVQVDYSTPLLKWDLLTKNSSQDKHLETARFGIFIHLNPLLLPYITVQDFDAFEGHVVAEFNTTLDGGTRIDVWFCALNGLQNNLTTCRNSRRLAGVVISHINQVLNRKLALLPTDGPGSFLA